MLTDDGKLDVWLPVASSSAAIPCAVKVPRASRDGLGDGAIDGELLVVREGRADVAAMEAAHVDLVIVGIPKNEPPSVIDRIAQALT